ncbi:hypothetical protein ACQ86N_30770 [Puia sp. P3]|uniref:hypothetical protein n=1 Tax=Puia sp. P3 TaxID=3423952 RepID=UPI003D67F2C2
MPKTSVPPTASIPRAPPPNPTPQPPSPTLTPDPPPSNPQPPVPPLSTRPSSKPPSPILTPSQPPNPTPSSSNSTNANSIPAILLSFSCDVPSFARDSTVGSLHLILEDIHTNRRWQYRYPIINGSASGDLVVGGGIQDGNYAVNFIVQSRFFRVEGKVKDYKEKLSPLTYVVMIRNKPGFMERIVPDPDGTFRLKPAYIEDTAYYVFSSAKKQQSSRLWLDIRTPMDSTFVPFASATKFITVSSQGDSIPLLAPSNLPLEHATTYRPRHPPDRHRSRQN